MARRKSIPAKPTRYHGILFRSRLEAKWAVAFDSISNILHWVYEPKTYTFKDGGTYTPDFLLTLYLEGEKVKMLVEIKPSEPTEDYIWYLSRHAIELPHMLTLLTGNLYLGKGDSSLTLGFCTIEAKAVRSPLKITSVFSNFPRSIGRALEYRFDLK